MGKVDLTEEDLLGKIIAGTVRLDLAEITYSVPQNLLHASKDFLP